MQADVLPKQYIDLSPEALIEKSLEREEGTLSGSGSLVVATGKRTGRSPKDKFIVQDAETENAIDWGSVNRPTTRDCFNRLWDRAVDYLSGKNTFIANLRVGADTTHYLPVRAITEYAWHNLFARYLFIDTYPAEDPEWTILSAPGLLTDPKRDGTHSDAVVMLDFTQKRVLICGMRYAGEMKKAMFTVMNFLLPPRNVLPMHCGANVGEKGDVALFFGLSGTGKTTLSSDPERYLIGDDEHGWGPNGVFNFEGGCYAKCIDLSAEKEPEIWKAIRKNTIMENVMLKPDTRLPDFANTELTKNTRAAYPLSHIDRRIESASGGHPVAVILLTCDLHGVLPPVAVLNKEQAAYYFLSGYTALVGSTEVGSAAEITTTFSACFGAPFFPRAPFVYAELLMKRIEETGARAYLVNTGWTGGSYAQGGHRFDIATTRAVVRAVIEGQIDLTSTQTLSGFGLEIPTALSGVDSQLLNPRNTWSNPEDYDKEASLLIRKFNDNFTQFSVAENIKNAGPKSKSDV